jgi:homoaconitase/3-isopropylmalate dehydratase large subunit
LSLDLPFLPEGWRKVLNVADPSKAVIIFGHLVPAPTVQAEKCTKTGRAFGKEFGIGATARYRRGPAHQQCGDR